ncbi:MAG TPA: hypothetical protein VE843_04890, partial [Ktedonobacteraceae bacterium]|nr:hypothetical protein [Ktedonobacteraceae bacterium]
KSILQGDFRASSDYDRIYLKDKDEFDSLEQKRLELQKSIMPDADESVSFREQFLKERQLDQINRREKEMLTNELNTWLATPEGKKAITNITYADLMINAVGSSVPDSSQSEGRPSSPNLFFWYLGWVTAMGCIGAGAFIGMNAISAQQDITFDISNQRLIILRVVLGGLFALVLTVSFGSQGFIEFCYYVGTGSRLGQGSNTGDGNPSLTRDLVLIVPFLLGFSTSLVILILNQIIQGIQAFFGKQLISVRTNETSSTSVSAPQAGAAD